MTKVLADQNSKTGTVPKLTLLEGERDALTFLVLAFVGDSGAHVTKRPGVPSNLYTVKGTEPALVSTE